MATRGDVARRVTTSRARGVSIYGARSLYGRRTLRDVRSLLLGIDPATSTLPPPATEADAMGLPPFGRGVALLANGIAGTDWYARRWDPDAGVHVRLADQPTCLVDPYPVSTPWHYRWAAAEDGILYGNHFALFGDVDFRTSRPGWLVPLPAADVWLLTDPSRPGWYRWTIGGEVLDPSEVFHVPFGNRSGELLGRGVLAQYAQTLGGYVAAEEHSAAYFAGGALPPAVLQAPQVVTQTQAEDLKAKWRSMTATREPVVLPTGYVLTPVVSDAESAQLVESRRWDAELVAMLLGVPGWKLGLPGPTMTYQNVETADIDFVRDDVDRFAAPLAHAFTKWLMPRGTEVVFDWAGRMRSDQSTLASVLTQYVAAKILTEDEARAVLSRPPLERSVDEGSTPEGTPELSPVEAT